ncbi:beta-phosphoglucomutase [Microbulbifer sp. OS29]|uniref:Beta-phosphoglucomutase n=1 Tax=Microbulbifer okhotskensis TaxID=2926617 RepID=A0A9X2J674_9GAMM|nr:beta-phosphoglucomutase [Microbulbifer okhotskensis]MCO1335953.1 beta-phosphoglucomutase [Microbulbifer okhotskensis]
MIYRAAIFDLDGVIADTARLHLQAWRQLADALQRPWAEDTEEKLKGLERMASLEVILGEKSSKYSTEGKIALAARKNSRYQELIRSLSPADLLPGASELLAWLSERHIPTALASASKNATAVLEALGISGYFSVVADPEMSAPKPSPDIFLAAARSLRIDPEFCIAFEDATAGIAAIKSAEGMTAIGVGNKETLAEADYNIESLTEFTPTDFFLSAIQAVSFN